MGRNIKHFRRNEKGIESRAQRRDCKIEVNGGLKEIM